MEQHLGIEVQIVRNVYESHINNTSLYRVYQNDWSGLKVDYIHKYGEETYK
jgi:hypothetical protein